MNDTYNDRINYSWMPANHIREYFIYYIYINIDLCNNWMYK